MEQYEIPDGPNRTHASSLPFDIDLYVSKTYEDANNLWQTMFKEEYLQQRLTELKKTLENHKIIYMQHFGPLINALKNKQKNIEVKEIGPDIDHYSDLDIKMRDRSVKNFHYILLIKGYNFTEKFVEQDVVDFLDGHCRKCTRVITVEY